MTNKIKKGKMIDYVLSIKKKKKEKLIIFFCNDLK